MFANIINFRKKLTSVVMLINISSKNRCMLSLPSMKSSLGLLDFAPTPKRRRRCGTTIPLFLSLEFIILSNSTCFGKMPLLVVFTNVSCKVGKTPEGLLVSTVGVRLKMLFSDRRDSCDAIDLHIISISMASCLEQHMMGVL
jgi:hypothetical protein